MGIRLSDDEIWSFVENGHIGILTTLKASGWPVSLPIWYVVVDRRIYIATPAQTKKVARLQRDDRGCFLVESGEAWMELAAVELPVRASVLEPGEEADAAQRSFVTKYAAYRPAPARLPGATTKHYSKQAVIRLDPAGPVLSWDNARIRLKTDDRESTPS
jgi:nitroimidazol reductase NimA-like FMN-containing flavoprotein (pyridoxamine 5'-phosphate oxidase superfamily)